jgi:hypothetical protein
MSSQIDSYGGPGEVTVDTLRGGMGTFVEDPARGVQRQAAQADQWATG